MDLRSQHLCNNYQKSIYHHWKHNRFSEVYHLPIQYEIRGALDIQLFSKAFHDVFSSQFAFALKFREGSGSEVACTYDASCLPSINHHTITGNDKLPMDYQLDLYKAKFYLRPFDLNRGKSFHIDLIRVNDTNMNVLLISCHSIICDTYILHELIRQVSKCYNSDEISPAKKLLFNMRKYLALNQYTMHFNKNANAFVKNEMEKLQSPSFFCLDLLPHTQASSPRKLVINRDFKNRIEKYCQVKNIQPYIFYLGCYQIFLHKVSGKEHLCTGTPIPNRPKKLFMDVAGYFVNTLPVISVITSTTFVDDLLQSLKLNMFNIIKNKNADVLLVNDMEKGSAAPHNTYDNIFSFINVAADLELNGCDLKSIPVKKKHPDCPLTVEVKEGADDVQINFINASRAYLSADITEVFSNLIQELLQPANKNIKDIRLVPPQNTNLYINNSGEDNLSLRSEENDYISNIFGSIKFQTPEKVA